MNFIGYDIIIEDVRDIRKEHIVNEKSVQAWRVSEAVALAIIDKYCPLPPNRKISICAIIEKGEKCEENKIL